MLGLDLIGADDVLGISWGDVGDFGKAAFPYVHATGKGVASAFGAGSAADALEHVEQGQGWLPASQSTAAATMSTSAQTVATVATPKLHPGASPKVPPSPSPSPPTPMTKPPSKPVTFGRVVLVASGVGVLGVVALVLRSVVRG